MDAQFTELFKVVKKEKAVKAETQKDKDDEFREAIQAIPEELKDSAFVTAYVKRRIIQRNKRESAKAERLRATTAINKMKKITESTEKILVGAWRSKDFQYELWELPNGKYHREIHARQGLKLS